MKEWGPIMGRGAWRGRRAVAAAGEGANKAACVLGGRLQRAVG